MATAAEHPRIASQIMPKVARLLKQGHPVATTLHEAGTDWKSKFPFHSVQEPVDKLYPYGVRGKKAPEGVVTKLKGAHKTFKKYVADIKRVVAGDPQLKTPADLAAKALKTFDTLMRTEDIGTWVNLNAQIKSAHYALYNMGKRAKLIKKLLTAATENPDLASRILPKVASLLK